MNTYTNKDDKTVSSFGDEWSRFDQSVLPLEEKERIFKEYFSIFPWDKLPKNALGVDIGCGSGRWASLVAQKVGNLICVDASSDALEVAKKNLKNCRNVSFIHSSLDKLPIRKNSLDFAYSLGVLHHIPDTKEGIIASVELLKVGAPLLLYLYYRFDNRPFWFRLIWITSDWLRSFISRSPKFFKNFMCDVVALTIYFPLAKISIFVEKMGFDSKNIPLTYYRNHSFYTMRTDARDRLGTPLEQRFTKDEIASMLADAGLTNVTFSNTQPYWCAVGFKA